eukprot:TRINITY_DN27142_c0_g1_i1.p1 TRINITY_DN27142_c0_g1~~TRINITY_DN27142_c0_g1_i1.p1  ORF type:complete len:458 (+),score=86.08 TRINITY_DN27142_c0_g1_i1:112-1485(+)
MRRQSGNASSQLGPHASEALHYLFLVRNCVIFFFVFALLRIVLEPLQGIFEWLLNLAAGLTGALLLRQDPWCKPLLGAASERLADSQLPEWAIRWVNLEDGFIFLMPLFYLCLFGTSFGVLHFLFLRPSHSTGFFGYLLPLVVVANTSVYILSAAFLWHIRGLVWRPHGAVTYADLSRAAAQVDHAELGSRPVSSESASGLAHGLLGAQPPSFARGTPWQRPAAEGARPARPGTEPPDADLALAIQRSLQDQGQSRNSPDSEAARAAPQQVSTPMQSAPASSQEPAQTRNLVHGATEAAHETRTNSAEPESAKPAEAEGSVSNKPPDEEEQEPNQQQDVAEREATPQADEGPRDLGEPQQVLEEAEDQIASQAVPERIELLFRMPSGKRLKCEFSASDVVGSLYDFVETHAASEPEIRHGRQYKLASLHPRRVYSVKQDTLSEAGLEHQLVVNVELQ